MTRNDHFNGAGSFSSGRPLAALLIHDNDAYGLFSQEYESVELLVFREGYDGGFDFLQKRRTTERVTKFWSGFVKFSKC